ncbi:MAG TPA: putative toxin-antitoxin system toxin component, PIN family [Acidimicrobiia bacterium]|nr:putative toxin-antitoxin system toxin component, PIN family [Acidimicrobiia bacterium]
MRVVLDTNVLVSAFLFPGGNPEAVYRRAIDGRLAMVTSAPLLSELARVLTDKFGWEQAMSDSALTQVVVIATVVEPTERLDVVRDDPADDRVLEAAVAGAAEVVVSGDRHLLRIGEFRGIRMLSPADFLTEFK